MRHTWQICVGIAQSSLCDHDQTSPRNNNKPSALSCDLISHSGTSCWQWLTSCRLWLVLPVFGLAYSQDRVVHLCQKSKWSLLSGHLSVVVSSPSLVDKTTLGLNILVVVVILVWEVTAGLLAGNDSKMVVLIDLPRCSVCLLLANSP